MIVNQYSEQLYWKIRRIVLQHEDANDILQNTFLKAWNSIGEFRNQSKISTWLKAWMALDDFKGKSKISTWLYRIAINESLDFVRRQKNKISADADLSVASRLLADEYFDGDRTQALLQEAIAQLPDVQRTVFLMKYFDDMKYSEISEILGTTEGALKASYHIAVKKITDYLKRKQ